MDPELNKLESEFSVRLDRWISKQGILFQLKHSYGTSSVIPKLFALMFRLLLVALVGLVIFWFYLQSRPNSEGFRLELEEQIKLGTNAAKVKVKSAERYKASLLDGQLKISDITLAGSENSFYEDWYADEVDGERNELLARAVVVQPLGIGDGVLNGWSGKKITVAHLQCHLKTGAESDELAMQSYLSLFKEYDSLVVNNIVIEDAHIGWGYDTSLGSIEGAEIEALKQNGVWKISVKGGAFSHGWLQNAKIDSMEIECHPNGSVNIVSADLSMGDGSFSFDASIQIKSKPIVEGKFAFEGVEVTQLVGEEYGRWLDGQLKGKGTLAGMLNSRQGISSTTEISLDAPPAIPLSAATDAPEQRKIKDSDSFLVLRGRFPILQAMQRINGVNSYNLLRLNIGSFIVEQTAGETQIRDISVRSDDFLIMNGELSYALASLRAKKKLELSNAKLKSLIQEEEEKINNPDADLATSRNIYNRSVKTFSGVINMGFIPQVFENHAEILDAYPEDENTLRVWIPVKMAGEIDNASSETADALEKIVQEARAKKENN